MHACACACVCGAEGPTARQPWAEPADPKRRCWLAGRQVLEPQRNRTQFDWSGCWMAEQHYPRDFPAAVVANLTNLYVQRQTQGQVLGGAFCAHYLYQPCVAVLIKELFPKAKVVAVYREPTCRAISSFLAKRNAAEGLNVVAVPDTATRKDLRRCYSQHSCVFLLPRRRLFRIGKWPIKRQEHQTTEPRMSNS
jgi:hypothetical protein